MPNKIDCDLTAIIEKRGVLPCFDYATKKCRALANALQCQTDDLTQVAAEAQVGLLLVQMILASRVGLKCVTGAVEKVVQEMLEENGLWED